MTSINEAFEEEFGEYANADVEDTMILGELGEAVEEEEARTGRVNRDETDYEETINSMRRNAVSEGSQNTYLCAMVNFLNWVYRSAQNQVYGESEPCSDSWLVELSVFGADGDDRRKKAIRQKLDAPSDDDPPLDFEKLVAGK